MVNPFVRFFRGSDSKLSANTETNVYTEMVRGDSGSAVESDLALKRQLALFTEAIHDEGVEEILFEKVMPKVFEAKFDEAGFPVFIKNDDGSLRLDGNGQPIPAVYEGRTINDYYAALVNYLSQVNRLSHIEPKMMKLHALYAEDILSDIMMNTPRSKINSGDIAYMKSIYNMILIALQDAVNGKKLNALLTAKSEKASEVTLRSSGEKKVL